MTKVDELRELIKESQGRLMGAWFYKKDGTLRKMVFRDRVSTGHPPPDWNDKRNQTLFERGMMNVYDVGVKDFRVLNLNTIIRIKVRGVEHVY